MDAYRRQPKLRQNWQAAENPSVRGLRSELKTEPKITFKIICEFKIHKDLFEHEEWGVNILVPD